MGRGVGGTIFVMLMLIGLYILVVHSGGAAKVLGALGSVTVNETQALQGPVTDTRGSF